MPVHPPLQLRCHVTELGFEVATAHIGWLFAHLGAEVALVDPLLDQRLDRLRQLMEQGTGAEDPQALASLGEASLLARKQLIATADVEQAHAELQRSLVILWSRNAMPACSSEQLHRRYPRALIVAVSPFGLTGTRRDWQANDFLSYHAGGDAYFLPPGPGATGRPPVVAGDFAPGRMAGWSALPAILAFARQARSSGEGRVIDISMQEALLDLSRVELARAANSGTAESRMTKGYETGGIMFAKDRPVILMPLEDHQWLRLYGIMGDPDWSQAPEFVTREGRSMHAPEIQARLQAWVAEHTSDQIYELGQAAGVPVGVVRRPGDIVTAAQTRERGAVEHESTPLGRLLLAPALPFRVVRPTPEASR